MDFDTAGLHKHAFRLRGKPLTFVRYQSQEDALEFLNAVCSSEHGLGVLEGRPLSGKTTVVNQFIEELPAETAVAVIDCKNLDTADFLTSILAQFGFELDAPTVNEQINFLKVFLVQHTSTDRAPLLFIENAHDMDTLTFHCLCQLIRARFHRKVAIRVVLMSNRSLSDVIKTSVSSDRQEVSEYSLEPMTIAETEDYINFKLSAAGCDDPERIVPWHLCDEIFEESKGYPGLIDRQILLRLKKADKLPLQSMHQVTPVSEPQPAGKAADDAPVLYITQSGKKPRKIRLEKAKTLIGRSELNEITINSSCMSRHHAMILRHEGASVLVDLNSTNGVFVNSRRVTSRVLRRDDVIVLGGHRIKVVDSGSQQRGHMSQSSLDDTATMKVLGDVSRVRAETASRAV